MECSCTTFNIVYSSSITIFFKACLFSVDIMLCRYIFQTESLWALLFSWCPYFCLLPNLTKSDEGALCQASQYRVREPATETSTCCAAPLCPLQDTQKRSYEPALQEVEPHTVLGWQIPMSTVEPLKSTLHAHFPTLHTSVEQGPCARVPEWCSVLWQKLWD